MQKAHTIGENLILPAAITMVTTKIRESNAKQLFSNPLSNDAVSHPISGTAEELHKQLVQKIRKKNCLQFR
jgi:hypothetical protein